MADRFTLDVISQGLDAAAVEMFEVLRKTAMSPIIYEVLDVGTGVLDAHGQLVSSGAGIPSFIGVLDKSVQAIIAKMEDTIVDGDVFLTNDPNYGGVTHLNDVVVAQPVFSNGSCVAWVASIAHWGDIGGRTPGSMSTKTTEIVAEGLRLPMVRLFNAGVRNEAVVDIITKNSRLPDFVRGDLWAQVSAGRRAATTIVQLCDGFGADALHFAITTARKTGEQRAVAGLRALQSGHFSFVEEQDDGTLWKASITITDERMTIDLRDAPAEAAGPYNLSRDGAFVACQVFYKALVDNDRFANAGSFAPLEVLTTPGTLFHAGPTAAHAYYFETRMKLVDMLWHGLAEAMPDLLPAGHFASIFGTVIAGQHPDTGRRYAMVEPQMGGWGATSKRAGQNAMFSTNHGDTFNCPVEIAEARYGFDVLEKALFFGPRIEGELSGGAGVRISYSLRNSAVLSVGYSHANVPVWSVRNGSSGGRNCLRISRTDGTIDTYHFASDIALGQGDVVEIETAFGGSRQAP
ncbi:MAG: hydantoinase B/oxoprolinase family protein [Paracoccaceae bacterium]|nr:hydantoinase B/oxoprolinase family protein [Paracoccaceae bacterium]MDG2256892.1 hydantoinase B/oxoprolinase family protein [Paracoccaceae bacterium]